MTGALRRMAALASVVVPAIAAQGQAVPTPASAAALDSGVTAYEDVSYDVAVRFLRRALAAQGADSLSASDRCTALSYLGAAEWYRQHQDSATAAFKTLLSHAPRTRIDSLVFARPVMAFFDGIRKSFHGVAHVYERGHQVLVNVIAINPHHVAVDVFASDGRKLTSLYNGPAEDSLAVVWDERNDDGTAVPAGWYAVVVTARTDEGRILSVAQFPINLVARDSADRRFRSTPSR